MEKIRLLELKDFINSDKDEAEYFISKTTDKSSLIRLEDFLIEFENKKQEYNGRITEPLKSIISKNKWVKDIFPSIIEGRIDIIYELFISSKNEPELFGKKENGKIVFSSTSFDTWRSMFERYYLTKREKIFDNSQDELLEIFSIANEVLKNSLIKTTASNKFKIFNFFRRSDIYCNDGFFFEFDRLCTGVDKLYFNGMPFYDSIGKDNTFKIEDAKTLIKKLYVRE